MAKIMLVGGAPPLNLDILEGKLNEVGLFVEAHVHTVPTVEVIPPGIDAVVVLTSMCSHGLSGTASALAKEHGIPLVLTTHKWSAAWPAFQRVLGPEGILPTISDEDATRLHDSRVYQHIVNLLVEFVQQGQPRPHQGKVLSAIRDEFGPETKLSRETYIRAWNEAKYGPPPKEEPMASEPQPIDTTVLSDYLIEIIREDPECMKNDGRLTDSLRDLFPNRELPEKKVLKRHFDQARSHLMAEWYEANQRPKRGEDKTEIKRKLMETKHRWLVGWVREVGKAPSRKSIQTRCKAIFGSSIHSDYIRAAIAEAKSAGVPAEGPLGVPEAFLLYSKLCDEQRVETPLFNNPEGMRCAIRAEALEGAFQIDDPKRPGHKLWQVPRETVEALVHAEAHPEGKADLEIEVADKAEEPEAVPAPPEPEPPKAQEPEVQPEPAPPVQMEDTREVITDLWEGKPGERITELGDLIRGANHLVGLANKTLKEVRNEVQSLRKENGELRDRVAKLESASRQVHGPYLDAVASSELDELLSDDPMPPAFDNLYESQRETSGALAHMVKMLLDLQEKMDKVPEGAPSVPAVPMSDVGAALGVLMQTGECTLHFRSSEPSDNEE